MPIFSRSCETDGVTTTQVTGPTPKVKMQRRLIMAAFAAAAVAAIAFGVISGGDKPELEPGAGIVELIPPEDDETFQQAPVGVQLESTYVGTIIINGTEIPADELQNPVDPESGELINARNRLVFQPG